jgi:hypothetical protein
VTTSSLFVGETNDQENENISKGRNTRQKRKKRNTEGVATM